MGLFDSITGLFGGNEASTDEQSTTAADDDPGADSPSSDDPEAATDDSVETAGPSGDEPDEVGPSWFAYTAEETVAEWDDLGLDYGVESVERLDDHAASDDNAINAVAEDRDAAGADAVARMQEGYAVNFGSYFGELLVRRRDGEWTETDDGWVVSIPVGDDEAIQVHPFDVAATSIRTDPRFAAALREVDAAREGAVDVATADAGEDVPAVTTGPAPEVDGTDELAARFRADAVELAEEWPRYALEFSPNSLVRLDTLVAEEFRQYDLADAQVGGEDSDSRILTAYTMATAGYLGTVFVRHCDAQWRVDDGPVLVVTGAESAAHLNPIGIAAAVLRGEDSFTATYEAVRSQLQIDAEGIDDDAGMAGITRPTERFVVTADSPGALTEAADALSAAWPAFDLDGTPASLSRLDALVAESDPEQVDVTRVGAYLGAVFADHYDAEWAEEGDAGWVVTLDDRTDDSDNPSVLVLPAVLRDCLDGADSFAAVHDAALARTGTEGPTVTDD